MYQLSLYGSVGDIIGIKYALHFLHFTEDIINIKETIYKDDKNNKLVLSKTNDINFLHLFSPPDTNKDRVTVCRHVNSTKIIVNYNNFDFTELGLTYMKDVDCTCIEFTNQKIYVRLMHENDAYFVFVYLHTENVIEDEKYMKSFCDELKLHVELIKPPNNIFIN